MTKIIAPFCRDLSSSSCGVGMSFVMIGSVSLSSCVHGSSFVHFVNLFMLPSRLESSSLVDGNA